MLLIYKIHIYRYYKYLKNYSYKPCKIHNNNLFLQYISNAAGKNR